MKLSGIPGRLRAAGLILALLPLAAKPAAAQDDVRALRIILASRPAPPEQFAAAELSRYLAAMGNQQPEIAEGREDGDIFLGVLPKAASGEGASSLQAALRGKDPDSFALRSFGGQLVIYGNSPRANLYGAYSYLESLGARWYFPGPENEVIPKAKPRLAGYDQTEIPAFHKRGIVIYFNTPGFRDMLDFAAKSKLNTLALHSDANLADAAKMVVSRGLDLDLERHLFGESFCPDDRATLEEERKKFTGYLSTLPPAMNDYFLWTADKFLKPCPSPEYRDYSVSDAVLWFSNQMVRTLREQKPQARFSFLSYLNTWPPPTHEKPAEGLILEWAPMFQSFARAMDDPASPASVEYRRDFEGLIELFGARNAQVLGYWLDDTLFSRTYYGKLPYRPRALQGDLAYYHRLGVPAVTTFGLITGRDYLLYHASPAVFLYPALLWNIGLDPGASVERFCREYFGAAAASEIYRLLDEADGMVYVERHKMHAEHVNDPEFLAKVSKAMEIAQGILRGQRDPEMRARAAKLVSEVSSRYIGRLQGPN